VPAVANAWYVRSSVRFGPPSVEKSLGALPVVAGFSRRLGIVGTIDRLCPVRDVVIVTVIEALIANRLTSPAPLVHVEEWTKAFAVAEALGVDPATLNDDRLRRALDAIAPHLDEIVGSIGATAIGGFGIDCSRLHWDMTSISLVGDCDTPEAGFILRPREKPKDRRVDRKQVQTGLEVTGDGGSWCSAGPITASRRSQPGRRRHGSSQEDGRPTVVPAGRRFQTGVLHQPGGPTLTTRRYLLDSYDFSPTVHGSRVNGESVRPTNGADHPACQSSGYPSRHRAPTCHDSGR
jgi:hypothetical protein